MIRANRRDGTITNRSLKSTRSCDSVLYRYTSVNTCKIKLDLPTIININARSLKAVKLDELQVIVDSYEISFACITETSFSEYMSNANLAL